MTKINYVTDYRDYLPFHVFSSCFVLKPSFTTGTQLLSLFLRMYAIEDTSYILLRKVQLHTLAYTTYFKESWIIAPSKNLSCCLSLMPEFLNLDTTDMLDWIILCCDGEWKRFSPLWEVQQHPWLPPELLPPVVTKSLQIVPDVLPGAKLSLVKNHCLSEKEKNKYHMLIHICGIQKNSIDDPIFKAEIETQMQRTNMDTKGEKGGQ